jgi:hypothetical protein
MNPDEQIRAQKAKQIIDEVEAAVRSRETERRAQELVQHYQMNQAEAFERRDAELRPHLQNLYNMYRGMVQSFEMLRQQRVIGKTKLRRERGRAKMSLEVTRNACEFQSWGWVFRVNNLEQFGWLTGGNTAGLF